MSLVIDTFSNKTGSGSAFFKAVGHPLCLPAAQEVVGKIKAARRAAAFDPQGTLAPFAALHAVAGNDFAAIYAQDITRFAAPTLAQETLPITDLENDNEVDLLFVPIFDAAIIVAQMRRLVSEACVIVTLDDMRLPDRFLADKRRYLNPVNFATNLVFFREQPGLHTRLVTANYWSAYGAKEPFMWGRLFAADGSVLTDFEKPLGGANQTVILDSAQIKDEFNLPDFCGQVFLHIAGAAGHDIVKYVADSYGDFADKNTAAELSCTHDANSFPADLYAGIPAPDEGDTVTLWIQNSHPTPIPANAIGVNQMGDDKVALIPDEIPAFATAGVDLGALLPNVRWAAQLEVQAGKHFVRPRYEVVNRARRRRINHANVERVDLAADENIPNLTKWLGKGYILPAPILPRDKFISECLPTPMSTAQQNLPLRATVYDSTGVEVAQHYFGKLPRKHEALLNLSDLAKDFGEEDYGHVELTYDFKDGGEADGWMHALFRYTEKGSGHMAETSFGAHMFNHMLTYKNEPQSYKGPPPGLTTRLFLRIAPAPIITFCLLIFPVGVRWNGESQTDFELKNQYGEHITTMTFFIPENGSFFFSPNNTFDRADLEKAGDNAYVIIRDTSCRLFGYHGALVEGFGDSFAFDHMFGF